MEDDLNQPEEDRVVTDAEALKPKPPTKFAPRGIETFTVCRQGDESGVSGTGVVIEGVQYDISVRDMATNAARIQATYSTSSADTTGYWVLEDPVLGVLPTVLAPG